MVAAVFVFSGGCGAVVDGLGAAPGMISVEQALTLACFSSFLSVLSFFLFVSLPPSLSLLISLHLREDS